MAFEVPLSSIKLLDELELKLSVKVVKVQNHRLRLRDRCQSVGKCRQIPQLEVLNALVDMRNKVKPKLVVIKLHFRQGVRKRYNIRRLQAVKVLHQHVDTICDLLPFLIKF